MEYKAIYMGNPPVEDEIRKIVHEHGPQPENLIAILQALQENYGFLPEKAFPLLASEMEISESRIYGVATFYAQFKFIKPGKHEIKVCMGTACHVKGSETLLNAMKSELEIEPGETTEDEFFSLERVACLGCCALSPVAMIDGKVHARMTRPKLISLLDRFNEEREG